MEIQSTINYTNIDLNVPLTDSGNSCEDICTIQQDPESQSPEVQAMKKEYPLIKVSVQQSPWESQQLRPSFMKQEQKRASRPFSRESITETIFLETPMNAYHNDHIGISESNFMAPAVSNTRR